MSTRSKTWWGKEFLRALEDCMDPGRLSRGRSYSTPYRRKSFSIRQGKIAATVRGNISTYFHVYETPYYKVEIGFQKIASTRWNAILKRLGSNADWVTHLVLGEVPPSIEEALDGASVKLLPRTHREIRAKCSCPDGVNPCKHIAGVYYHVASLVDRDPLLLFEFRGLDRSKLLEAVSKSEFGSALHGEADAGVPDLAASAREPRYPSVGAARSEAPSSDLRAFWRGRPVPKEADRQVPPVSALLLRRAGDYPEFWHREISFLETMAAIYERVAKGLPPARRQGQGSDERRSVESGQGPVSESM